MPTINTRSTLDSVTITINGRPQQARVGEILLAALQRAGIAVPALCADSRLNRQVIAGYAASKWRVGNGQ